MHLAPAHRLGSKLGRLHIAQRTLVYSGGPTIAPAMSRTIIPNPSPRSMPDDYSRSRLCKPWGHPRKVLASFWNSAQHQFRTQSKPVATPACSPLQILQHPLQISPPHGPVPSPGSEVKSHKSFTAVRYSRWIASAVRGDAPPPSSTSQRKHGSRDYRRQQRFQCSASNGPIAARGFRTKRLQHQRLHRRLSAAWHNGTCSHRQ